MEVKTYKTYKSYNDLESLKEHLVEQGKTVKFEFPQTLSQDDIREIQQDTHKLKTTCSCSEWSLQPDNLQITFVVKAPMFTQELTVPYLKSVTPHFTSDVGHRIQWEIKFYVNPKK